jgi:hypothetical protein
MQTCWCFRLSTEELVLAKRSIRSFSVGEGAQVAATLHAFLAATENRRK